MTLSRNILVAFLSGAISCAPVLASNCDSEMYRRYNPDLCSRVNDTPDSKMSFATAAAITGGTAALIGGTIALLGASGGDSGSDNHTSSTNVQPTLPTYTMVGADVDSVSLASIIGTDEYATNANSYDDIRVAYSLARGYTGKNSNIAVFDSGISSWHGAQVVALASGAVAPDANVKSYLITDWYGEFQSFDKIGDKIATATNANIYNFSWSMDIFATQVKSRAHLERITDKHFIDTLSNAATQNDAIFVWAAGNDYASQSSALSAMPLHVPELDGHFVNVVAWDSEKQQLADFSNECGVTKNFCITAPGANINSPTTNETINGTSFAAPIVSAAIAVIREAFPYMKSNEITSLLFATARDLGAAGVDTVYGHGMLDLEHATRPVGAALVPLTDTKTVALNTARVSASIGNQIKSKNIKFAFIDSFGRAFETNLNDNISIKNRGIGYERLREQNANSVKIGNIEFGFKENDMLMANGFLQTDGNNLISFIGFNNATNIGNTTIFQRTTLGISNPHAAPESMVSGFSNVYTASVSVGAKYGDWTFSVGTPDTIIGGNMYLRTPTGRSTNGEYTYRDYAIDLASRPSIEYGASYKFLHMGFVDNAYGTDEFYMLAKTKIQF